MSQDSTLETHLSTSPDAVVGLPREVNLVAFAVAIFAGAFLVFQVQPIMGRYILPWFGGSPGVWTACMLFFQSCLLAGYGYAHVLARQVSVRRQPLVHLCLVMLSLVWLPVTPEPPADLNVAASPASVLSLLAATVALPFVLLSATAPLMQHWFAGLYPARNPYRLYALSNLGSLIGLLGYPFVVERWLSLEMQTVVWSLGYVAVAVVCLCAAWPVWTGRGVPVRAESGSAVTWPRRAVWLMLSSVGSVVLLVLTNQMTQDVAPVPFLWVVPLALYLLTFIFCFERDAWYRRSLWIPMLVVTLASLVYLLHRDYSEREMALVLQVSIYCGAVFACCMVCHGELAARRPDHGDLTAFYLYLALGGALGGVLVNLVAPLVFDGYWELHCVLVGVALIATAGLRRGLLGYAQTWRSGALMLSLAAVVVLSGTLFAHYADRTDESIHASRGFHGVLQVYESEAGTFGHTRRLSHGRISHGTQWLGSNAEPRPTSYYGYHSGVALALQRHPAVLRGEALRVGAIGLGVGTIAAYARQGDDYRFYELNPEVERLARDYFTFLHAAEQRGAEVDVLIGDGRLVLARQPPDQLLDVLVVDAFSGDSVPMHLLTQEAYDLYWQHLAPNGILAVHISNLHLDLSDVVRTLADRSGRVALHVEDDGDGYEHDSSNEWVLVTANRRFIADAQVQRSQTRWTREVRDVLWTDDYANLFDVVDW